MLFNDERTEAQLIDWGTGMSVTANEIRPAVSTLTPDLPTTRTDVWMIDVVCKLCTL